MCKTLSLCEKNVIWKYPLYLTYNHPTYDQPKLRSKFPYENFSSNFYKNVIKISFWISFKIVRINCWLSQFLLFGWCLYSLLCYIKTNCLNTYWPAEGCLFHSISYFKLMTRFSEHIMFISWRGPVLEMKSLS